MPTIHLVTENKKRLLPLLLEADPCEVMIDRYLKAGDLFVLEKDNVPICVAVVLPISGTACELKNLATDQRFRGQGHAARMLCFLFKRYAFRFRTMLVGTSENGVELYRRFGFMPSHTVPGFFTSQYPEPILDNGRPCVDMLYLKKDLQPLE